MRMFQVLLQVAIIDYPSVVRQDEDRGSVWRSPSREFPRNQEVK